jgi:hypothetical protein
VKHLHVAACLLAALALSCGEDRGEGCVVGSLVIPDCEAGETLRFTCADDVPLDECTAFDLDADFFALETLDEIAVLRMQKGGRTFAQTDGLLVQIRDVRLLRGNLGTVLPVGPSANIRAALGLFELCPDTTQNFELSGEIVFEKFGVDKGNDVRGTIKFLEVREGVRCSNERDDTGPRCNSDRLRGNHGQVLGLLHGRFDFRVRQGPPHQQFTGR